MEIIVVVVIALLVFGPNKLPDLARQAGEAMRELRKVQGSVRGEINKAMRETAPTIPPRDPSEPSRHLRAIDADHETAAPPSTPVEPGDSFS